MPNTILLVDDSPTIRTLLKVLLLPFQPEIMEAEDGSRALQLVRLMPMNLVIADVKMPGMDGIEFVREVRASGREDLKRLPIILLTGQQGQDLKERGKAAGANDFLLKPVDRQKLQELVKRYLPEKHP